MRKRSQPSPSSFDALLAQVRDCRVCEAQLPLGPRPVLRAHPDARILIVGQAPGTRVHATGIPWNDASGKRLREWMGVDDTTFYDETRIAIVPMGFCYPGRGRSGDNPPRPECARLWMDQILAGLPHIELTLLVGRYAQTRFLGSSNKASLTETVMAWRDFAPRFIPLPHPSPRNQGWFKHHPWFGEEVLPMVRDRVARVVGQAAALPASDASGLVGRDGGPRLL